MLSSIVLAIWGCMYDLDPTCPKSLDMSNAASTWIGIIIGALIGGIITWWVYNRQNKTSKMQDEIIENIENMVKKMDHQEEMYRAHQDKILNKLLRLDSRIDSMLEKK